MERLNVNPTRMELQKQKNRLRTSIRGHKLLKDKSDEMMRQFMSLIKQNQVLRKQIEEDLRRALNSFIAARTQMTNQALENAVSIAAVDYEYSAGYTNVMGLVVPKLSFTRLNLLENLPYSFTTTPSQLDVSVRILSQSLNKILLLAEVEKTCDMLASEIEKNRKRTNALEFILIPQIKETIKYISMKLQENERNNIVRLMKVKELIQTHK